MEKISNEWANLEQYIGFEVPICLKILLWKSGFDSMFSVKQISEKSLDDIEQYIQMNRKKIFLEIFPLLDTNADIHEYDQQPVFKFLPGHRCILLDLPQSIKNMQADSSIFANRSINTVPKIECDSFIPEYSVILSALIKTAKKNHNMPKNHNQYDDIIRYFSTYIFLLCGRTCYETLNKNLPMPSTKTICE